MNKSKIEWCDYTWNPVTGCLHGCDFCYARKIDKRFGDGSFMPTFHPERLQEPMKVKKPSRIFVGSMADLFGDWGWIDNGNHYFKFSPQVTVRRTLQTVAQCPEHTFIFLTKNPKGMQGFDFPANCWCGTSVENQEKADERIPELLKVNCGTLFVSIEPILAPICFHPSLLDQGRYGQYGFKVLRWLIIGAQTGPGAVKPDPQWIQDIIDQAKGRGNVPIFIKDNVKWHKQIQEWPGVTL